MHAIGIRKSGHAGRQNSFAFAIDVEGWILRYTLRLNTAASQLCNLGSYCGVGYIGLP